MLNRKKHKINTLILIIEAFYGKVQDSKILWQQNECNEAKLNA